MIDAFLHGLELIFARLIAASWQASVLVALVLLLHLILRGRLNPRWHHALWLLVIARLLLPFLPESALSLFQFLPSPPPVVTETVTKPIFNAFPAPMVGTLLLPAPPVAYPFSAFTVLALVWLTGALGLLILTWEVNRRFARHVGAAPLVTDPRLLKLADIAQRELGVHRRLRIIESAQVQSPAIMGVFRPTLILPKNVCARFDDDELRFIFLHEFAHLKRGDLFLQWLVALLQILHWFNPVLWYAFRRMRADREPATDALVLSFTGEASKEAYGQVLVKLLEQYRQRHSLPTLVGILEDKDQFKRRFSLIARFTQGAYGWSMLGILLFGVLSIACLTQSKATASVAPAPPAEPNGKNSGETAYVQVKAVKIAEKDYQAHRSEIDAALKKGDSAPLSNLKSFQLLTQRAVVMRTGETCTLKAVQPFSFPKGFATDATGKNLPTGLIEKQDLGFEFTLSPLVTDAKIAVTCTFNLTTLQSWVRGGVDVYFPAFNGSSLIVSESFDSGQTRGWAVVVPEPEPLDTTGPYDAGKIARDSHNPRKLRRVFLFLTVKSERAAVQPRP